MWFMEEPSQFSVGQTAQILTCSIKEKPHTGLDDCLNMLLACFRKRMSERERDSSATGEQLERQSQWRSRFWVDQHDPAKTSPAVGHFDFGLVCGQKAKLSSLRLRAHPTRRPLSEFDISSLVRDGGLGLPSGIVGNFFSWS